MCASWLPIHKVDLDARSNRISAVLRVRIGFDVSPLQRPHPRGIVRVTALRNQLEAQKNSHPGATHAPAISQTGSAAFAISVLDPPWRQRFEGTADFAGDPPPPPGKFLGISQIVQQAQLKVAIATVLGGN